MAYKAKAIAKLAAEIPPDALIRRQRRRCGDPSCTRCPHGPYWYAQKRVKGRKRTWYVGSDKRLEELRAEWARVAPELFPQKDRAAETLAAPAAQVVHEGEPCERRAESTR